MYRIKKEVYNNYKKYGDTRKIAKETGYSENYISQILNGRKFDRKMLAYIITKIINPNLEMNEVFEIFH